MNTVKALLISTKQDHAFDLDGKYLGKATEDAYGSFTFADTPDFNAEAFKSERTWWQVYIVRDGKRVAHRDMTGTYAEAVAYAEQGIRAYSGTDEELQERLDENAMEAAIRISNELIGNVPVEDTLPTLIELFEAEEYQMHPARGMVCSRDVMVGDTEYKAHLHRSQNPFDGTFSYTSVFKSMRRGAVGVSVWSFNSDGTTDGYTPVEWEKAIHEQYFAQLKRAAVNA